LWVSISNGVTGVRAGDELVYLISYGNVGNGRAYNTAIYASAPSSNLVEDLDCWPSANCEIEGGYVTFGIGTLPSGSGGSVRISMRVRDPLPAGLYNLVAAATISTPTPGDPPQDNQAQDIDEIITRPDLQVSVDYHNHTPYPGKRVTYTISYSNTGHIATDGVMVTVTQPPFSTYQMDGSDNWQDAGDGRFQYPVGSMDYEDAGTLVFVMTLPTGTFSQTMSNFDAVFGIVDDGGSGPDANSTDNVAVAALGVPDVVVDEVDVNWESLLDGRFGRHITVTLRNLGGVTACNPIAGPGGPADFCAGFYVDLYFNPDRVPASYPSDNFYGDVPVSGLIIPAQSTKSVVFEFDASSFLEQKVALWPIYVRVDNLKLDPDRPYGSVPEYDEFNNVSKPIYRYYLLYMPLAYRGY
jgi:uncharacterized repeat protein (TIGR01451 family)